jgi:hypothetical protein
MSRLVEASIYLWFLDDKLASKLLLLSVVTCDLNNPHSLDASTENFPILFSINS